MILAAGAARLGSTQGGLGSTVRAVSMLEVAPSRAGAPDRAGRPRRLRRVLVSLALASALTAVGPAGLWWITHPDRSGPISSSIELALPIGETAVFGMYAAHPREGSVTLLAAEPVMTVNTSEAVVRVLVCRRPVDGSYIGSVRGRADEACLGLDEPRGISLQETTLEGGAQLIAEVTPRRPGIVRMEGLRVRYRSGLRWGDEVAGTRVIASTVALTSSPTQSPSR